MHKRLYHSFDHFSDLVHLSGQNFPAESFIHPIPRRRVAGTLSGGQVMDIGKRCRSRSVPIIVRVASFRLIEM